jgi:hypothetical protein
MKKKKWQRDCLLDEDRSCGAAVCHHGESLSSGKSKWAEVIDNHQWWGKCSRADDDGNCFLMDALDAISFWADLLAAGKGGAYLQVLLHPLQCMHSLLRT